MKIKKCSSLVSYEVKSETKKIEKMKNMTVRILESQAQRWAAASSFIEGKGGVIKSVQEVLALEYAKRLHELENEVLRLTAESAGTARAVKNEAAKPEQQYRSFSDCPDEIKGLVVEWINEALPLALLEKIAPHVAKFHGATAVQKMTAAAQGNITNAVDSAISKIFKMTVDDFINIPENRIPTPLAK